MTVLVVETGTGIAGANTYASANHASNYHAQRGTIDAWQQLVEDIGLVGALVDATRRLDRTYAWLGAIASTTQGLALPRRTITLDDGRQLTGAGQVALAADATSMLALKVHQERATSGPQVLSERLGDAAWTYADEDRTYPEVDTIMAPIVDVGGMSGGPRNIRTVRWS